MSNKFIRGGVIAGSTSVSLLVNLRVLSTGAGLTGITAGANAVFYYYRQGAAAAVQQVTTALTNLNDAFSAGGWKEVSSANMPGAYRLDIPDAALAAGADWVDVQINTTGQPYVERIQLTADAYATGDAYSFLTTPYEGTRTFLGLMKLIRAKLAGKANGGGTGTLHYRDSADGVNVITETVDGLGNRTTVVTADVTE